MDSRKLKSWERGGKGKKESILATPPLLPFLETISKTSMVLEVAKNLEHPCGESDHVQYWVGKLPKKGE